jgi:hypothetical protein
VGRVLSRQLGKREAEKIDLNRIENKRLRNMVRQLFREQDKRPGGTAGEIRRNARAGVEDPGHVTKAQANTRALEKVLRDRSAKPFEKDIARALMKDLHSALREYHQRIQP